ncbi:MAG: glycosyltransferase [Clostridium sp.]|jgi:glycosyltransferase involved in cell wall biosynthesis|uniref:glycosyltransferase n=1 Tax=Clostridium sp. TaxID=1506 RepID=UPI0025BD9DAA|nr:glycosyltransferase [Clostridium sp.]MCH3962840.1 glycosyltransferase [Clostridium sp.]MCI1715745.1 glycosyltransferase [Clostridium sp.]MCI1800050.1 glycosyltransferase [Clostridium sp.]MCI1813964.1 glycosyltransferase [Clostridium sp.]MCI1870862.1 glycosyltransferase [Clostridium sp.]
MATFIQMPTVPYNRMYQRPQQIMRKLSERGHTVYYMDNIRENYIIRINKKLYEIGANYSIDTNRLERPIILWCSHPENVTRIDNLYHDYIIFDIIDDYSYEFESWNVYLKDMLKAANIIFATSEELYNKFLTECHKIYMIKNGLDIENFSPDKKSIPADLPSGKKIVGYVGAVAGWIDWELIKYISGGNYNIVFIGPKIGSIDLEFNKNNVYFLGEKKYWQLPFYISNFNCCIIPFKVNKMTNSCDPIKLYEYMALGKPVVSTAIHEIIKLGNLCYVSRNFTEFIINLNKAINDIDMETAIARRRFSINNSWDERVDLVIKKLKDDNIL